MLKVGEGKFYITGIKATDKNGEELVMKNGGKYKKIKLMVTDRTGNSENVFDPVFGSGKEKIEQIVNSIGSPDLKKDFNSGRFDLTDLVGYSGQCIVGERKKEGYDPQNTIECYLKFKSHSQDAMDAFKDFNPTLEKSDEIPF